MMSVYLPTVASLADAVSSAIADNTEQVEVWRRTDVILTAEKSYDNPYKDVDIDAVFTHEDGTEIKLYGFWNGGSEWRVRFSPTKVGVWTYKITATDTSDKGLNVSGKLLAVENTGTTDIDRHGFVEISENGRYFEHADGTPFYWLGDTNWQAPNYVSLTQCNYPNCSCGSQFLHEVNDRLSKGFTVYQTYFDSAESDGGGQLETTSEPSIWSVKDNYELINPDTFTDKIDVMFDTLADSGMVIALGMGVHWHTTNAMDDESLCRITRYLTARYASYPVVWITAQEITSSAQYESWVASAEVVDAGDGYNHPQGAHQFPSDVNGEYVVKLDSEEWHEFYALQAGHGPTYANKSLYEGYWNNERNDSPKPYIESEANYEDITCGGFNGYDASRIAAWKANLCGSYGFTYGATGVWANNYSTAGNTGWYGTFSYEPWYMGIDKPGSYEMAYMASFFRYVDFSTLVPRFYNESYSNLLAENKVLASSDDGKTYVAYFYNSSLTTGELYGLLEGETYSAKWYNPLTGKFVAITDSCEVTNGVYKIPSKPTTGDWVLLVTCRDLGEYETEQAYTDDKIDTRINYSFDATATASSDNGEMHIASSAIDGSLADKSYWCASDGTMPQWLLLDFGKAVSFSEVELITYAGKERITESASFVIEGSSDGETFETLYTADKMEPVLYLGKHYFRLSLSGTYRYLRVTFSEFATADGIGNWATLYELAVYDRTSENTLPEESDPNILTNATATASSDTGSTSTPDKAIDGSSSTYWCARGDSNQWILFDLGSVKSFDTYSFTMYGGTTSISYTMEISDDGSNFTTVLSAEELAPTGKSGNSELFEGTLDTPVSGRYLRLYFTKAVGNWVTIVELSAELNSTVDDILPTYEGVLQTPDISGTGGYVYTAEGVGSETLGNLTDGDADTVWTPFSNISSQTLIMDLGEAKTLYGITVTLGDSATLPIYRIEGSLDNKSWTILADATLRSTSLYSVGGRDVMSEALTGSYRYVKLLWLGGDSVKTIAEIELYADGATLPTSKPSVDALLTEYNRLFSLNNSDKTYTADSYRSFCKARFQAAVCLMPETAASQDAVDAAKTELLAAENELVELLGAKGEFKSYISYRQNASTHDLRFVMAVDTDLLAGKNTVDVTVTFTCDGGNKTLTMTLSDGADSDFELYYNVNGAGKTYQGRPEVALFGLVVTDIDANAWTSVRLTATADDGTVLTDGSVLYSDLIG